MSVSYPKRPVFLVLAVESLNAAIFVGGQKAPFSHGFNAERP
jgi:hypothetical protein